MVVILILLLHYGSLRVLKFYGTLQKNQCGGPNNELLGNKLQPTIVKRTTLKRLPPDLDGAKKGGLVRP